MLLAQRYPIDRVGSGLVIVWGICLILTTVCRNWQDLYVQRFFLGFLESGISPLFMLIVGSWYRKDEQAFRMGYVTLLSSHEPKEHVRPLGYSMD